MTEQYNIEQLEKDSGRYQKETSKTVTGGRSLWKGLLNLISGNILGDEIALKQLPFVLYLGLLAFLYISNNYFADTTFSNIKKVTRDVRELRYEYISTTSYLMHICKQSQISDRLKMQGIKESKVPPYKIYNENVVAE